MKKSITEGRITDMRCLGIRILFILVIIIVLFVSLLGFNGCRQDLTLPYTPLKLGPPPVEISIEKVYDDYMVDAEEAEARYMGQRFLFKGLVVDKVRSFRLNMIPMDISIMVGNVKFKPRYESDLDQIGPGFVIDVTGVPRSLLLDRILIVTDCLVYIVEGGEIEQLVAY